MKHEKLSLETQELLARLEKESPSQADKERLTAAIDALQFIYAMGQSQSFLEYRQSLADRAPPLVVAAFDTRAEADAWLMTRSPVPDRASVLIAGAYFTVMDLPELRQRRLVPSPVLQFYLEAMREQAGAPVFRFTSHAEAETWLKSQGEPPRQVVIQIGDRPYLAAYHPQVRVRALYPLFETGAAPT
ncbi:head protein [Corallococcus sp. CA053C]|uniref:head protein n=1 Tax=Corallococcus sp. CA053C TaxID=2316732 RepID=UPI000EA2FCF8|nr:head protein [Corallococcus sp. CA053C]RKG99327.1 head protein [Corallococcus sp. CA053C]